MEMWINQNFTQLESSTITGLLTELTIASLKQMANVEEFQKNLSDDVQVTGLV